MNLYSMFYGNGGGRESERDAHPHGLRLFFSVIKWHWGRLIGLNVLFILSCLPIVTIPCAMTAMSEVLGRLVQRRVCYPAHDYRAAFAREWKRSSLSGLAVFAVLALAVVGASFYLRSGSSAGIALAGLCVAIAAFAIMAMTYVFPLVAFTDLPVRDVLKNAVLLTQMRLGQSLGALVAIVAILVVSYVGLPYTVLVMPVFGCSLIGLIGVFSAWGGIGRYVIVDDAADVRGADGCAAGGRNSANDTQGGAR
ncbi:YesL family protein [Bifidobacterium biavatii]|uniref:Putative integral membrane protein n=1 Tax=Bifidobacterium biavatii DSM 23969 TaxID=1437608 RepID=A0A087A154_9BIFI|nr:DUF624 domain-containing protein [Bifidobacterium biavatii]KFI52504.1 putative integral membrane protein [Bifidobacterium biavatii DSM 23969]